MRLYQKFMETISPGVIMDMTSDAPKILASFWSCQTVRVDHKGQEPDISSGKVEVQHYCLERRNSHRNRNVEVIFIITPWV
jgi:hypothetical protein